MTNLLAPSDLVRLGTLAARPTYTARPADSGFQYVVTDGPFGLYICTWDHSLGVAGEWRVTTPPVGGGVYDAGDGSAFDSTKVAPGQMIWFHNTYTPPDVASTDGSTIALTLPAGFVSTSPFLGQIITLADPETDSDLTVTDDASNSYNAYLNTYGTHPNPATCQPGTIFIVGVNAASGAAFPTAGILADSWARPQDVHISPQYVVNVTPGVTAPTLYITVSGVLLGLTV